jgi:NADPH:quinone reductase-like Zn-dependent oxidoreductase
MTETQTPARTTPTTARSVIYRRTGGPDVLEVVDKPVRDPGYAGLPQHHFPLERTADAHAEVEAGAVGKVLIDVVPD